MGPRNAQELPWWPSGRELGPQKCPKRGLGSVLATNFAPKGVPIGAWGAFFKRQGGVLALRNAQELLWWPSGRQLGPQEPFPDGRIQPNCFRNASRGFQDASRSPPGALGPPDVEASKLMNKKYTNLIHHAQILWAGLGGCAKRKQFRSFQIFTKYLCIPTHLHYIRLTFLLAL